MFIHLIYRGGYDVSKRCLFLQMQPKALILLYFIISIQLLSAQTPSYPKFYFRNPLRIPMQLVANFGELRPNHWHMGLDIRTNQKENQSVYSAAAGYITHVGIRPQSFGRYIIINHPNGLSTLYAHLNNFFYELEQYVKEQQYNEESWAVELDLPKNRFLVAAGQFIAYSGNTGGSQGPHLHFEIRDTKSGKCLNPLLFNFPIKDNVPPTIVRLASYDRDYSVFEQTPEVYLVKTTDSGYVLANNPVIRTGAKKLSFAIQAFDRMTGSANPNGIYAANISYDGTPVGGFVLDSIDYDATQYLNAHIDYPYRFNGGVYLQHLTHLPGDQGLIYWINDRDGLIHLSDTNVHRIRIDVRDANSNTSQLNFSLQYVDSLATLSRTDSNVVENVHRHFLPRQKNELIKPDFEIYLPVDCLYDSIQPLYFRNNSSLPYAVSALHRLNDASIPIHDDIVVRLMPDRPIMDSWKDKLLIQRNYRNSNSIRRARWESDSTGKGVWLTAKFGDLGSFQAFVDTIPPYINEPGTGDTIDLSKQTKIVLEPRDNFNEIRNFRAELDSQWICFTNDKGRNWTYEFDDRWRFGVHRLKVSVEDLVGNVETREWWFKRYPYTPPKKIVKKKQKQGKKK